MSIFGTSKYAVDKSKGIGSIVAQGVLPVPLTQLVAGADHIHKAVTDDKWEELGRKVLEQTPVAGKVLREEAFTNWSNR